MCLGNKLLVDSGEFTLEPSKIFFVSKSSLRLNKIKSSKIITFLLVLKTLLLTIFLI